MGRFEETAIIGISGLFPEADTLDRWHKNLLEGRDSVRPLSLDRMYFTSIDPSGDYAPIGFLDRVDLFDHRFFNISPREAEFMDPHQRLSLQLVCTAIENAGYSLDALKGTDAGVFLSAPRPEYQELFTAPDPLELLGNAPSATAGRISYFLDLRGPSLVLDAGCCGSLVAVEHARRELAHGAARVAIAGGLSLTLLFEPKSANASFAEIMSPDARCKAFDASANGAAAGEGGGFVVLKRLSDALEDGDQIHAVIKGGAVNHNGFRSNGLSAPSPAAQKDVILAAWDDAGVDASTISFVEAHGSGTKLGDVIEAQALSEAFAERGVRSQSCAISSVKTNIGHLDHAAGIAGFIKAVLALKHRTLYRSLHYETPNPLIDMENSATYVQESSVAWDAPPGGVRRAGVSSFSLAGTNVHVVLEEAPIREATPGAEPAERHLVTLSARTATQFRHYREMLAGFVAESDEPVNAIAHVLNRGRNDEEFRAAAVVDDRGALQEWLRSATGEKTEAADVAVLFSGDVHFESDAIERIADAHPSARALLDELNAWGADLADVSTARFAYQLVAHAALRDLGLAEIAVLGSGAGNAAVKVVRGQTTVAGALESFGDLEGSSAPDENKLAAALEALAPARTIFVELGASGALSAAVAAAHQEVARIVAVNDEPLQALARLYAAGASIDWERHYAGQKIAHVEVPARPFAQERCWYLPAGRHRATVPGRADITAPPAGGENVLRATFATDTQAELAAIWREALGVAPDGASADYFELGGTSITGMVVLERVEREFGVRLTFQELYEHNTLEDLSLRIDELATAEDDRSPEPELVPIPRGGYLPVSIGQEQIWFIDQLEPNTPLYNIPFDLHIRGDLDENALGRAIARLSERHEVLRTSFVAVGGEARAVVEADPKVDVPVIDISHLPAEERRARGLALWADEASQPFELSRGPLFRATLLRLAPDEHVLLMTIHHIIYDGWTPSIIQGELAALYDEEANGNPADLPPLDIQYADYADWQRRWAASEAMTRDLAYWRRHLEGAPVLDLPTDHPRRGAQSYRGEMITFELDSELIDSLRALSRSQGVTLFTTMMSAVCILMQRYSDQDDIVIGTPTSGRKRPGIRGLIGYFNNMLPVRSDLSGDPTFLDLMHRVRDVIAGALDHDEVPFEKMVEDLRPDRDLARNPLFQVAYSHQNAPQEGYSLPGMEVANFAEGSIRGIAPGTSKFDLTIGVGDGGEGELEGYFEYAIDLFDQETIEVMIGHFERLLRSIAATPDKPLSQLGMSDDAGGGVTGRPSRAAALTPVHAAIAGWARSRPDALAIAGESSLTYAELDGRSDGLASHLASLGVSLEDRVAVVLPRTADLIVAQMATMKAGAAFVAIDPGHPPARIAAAITGADVSAVVSTSKTEVGETDAPVVLLDRDDVPWDRPAPPIALAPGNAAYVIFTSGSTGTPKGVVVTHGSLANLCAWHLDSYGIVPEDRATHLAPLAFDATVWEAWPYLVAGASLHLVPDADRVDPWLLRRRLIEERITMAFAPTGVAHALLDTRWPADTKLRALLTGGERLVGTPPQSFPARFVNHYGPTENTVVATAVEVPAGSTEVPGIGAPIDGVRAYVLDRRLRPVPPGARGELYLGGVGLARGYLGRADLTAERFLPDPIAEEPGSRMYATGDMVRLRHGGGLDFLGRRDDQVKVRGFRVELGEIEYALRSHPDVTEAVVVARATGESTRLIGYVVPRDVAGAPADEIRAHLKDLLPAHMVPAGIVPIHAIPRTHNGKIDKSALPQEEGRRRSEHVEPRNATERALARIWSEVLGAERVGITDNFFDLGGDSILSIQIVARANAAGLRVGAKDMFRAQTVEALARRARSEGAIVDAEQGPVTGPLPLTPIQRWFLDRAPADVDRFDQTVLLDVPHDVDVLVLRTALDELAMHHDALRLRVRRHGSEWTAHIAAEPGEILMDPDVTGDPSEIAQEVHSSLSLSEGPVLRAALMEAGSRKKLFVTVHHFAVDAVSWPILIDDLAAAYGAAARGAAVEFPKKTTSIKTWAERLEELARDPEVAAHVQGWSTRVGGSGGRLIRDHDGSNLAAGEASVQVELDASTTAALTSYVAAASKASMPELLLAGLAVALREGVDGSAIDVDMEGHGREDLGDDVDTSRTVGWFTSLFPIRLQLDDAGDPMRNLSGVKESLRAIPGITFGLLRFSAGNAELRDMPAPEISFNYLGRFDGGVSNGTFVVADGETGASLGPANDRSHLLAVEAQIEDGKLVSTWAYSEEVHERASIESLARHFVDALEDLVERWRAGARPVPTPADFPLAGLNEASLERIASAIDDIEDIYGMSPMQEGLLFHSKLDPSSGVYTEQLNFVVEGPLDSEIFALAWKVVSERHEMLRSAVATNARNEPVHVIRRDARPPVAFVDLSEMDPADRSTHLDRFFFDDLARGFDLAQGPLLRIALFRESPDAHRVVWTHHHLILDGWSVQLVLGEVFSAYAALSAGERVDLKTSGSYKDFIGWLATPAEEDPASYWGSELVGVNTPTRMPLVPPAAAATGTELVVAEISRRDTETLQRFARDSRVTLATVAHGAWAQLLGLYTGADDIMFGATVSGRSADIPDVERAVGLFINTIPVRVRLASGAGVAKWLAELQERLVASRRFEHVSLVDVQKRTGIPAGEPMFETVLAFENYPIDAVWDEAPSDLTISSDRYVEQTNYPLAVVVAPAEELAIRISYDRTRFTTEDVGRVIDHFVAIMMSFACDPEAPFEAASAGIDPASIAAIRASAPVLESAAPRTAVAGFVAPRTRTEDILAKIWTDILEVDRVGVMDSFFALGGHSLLATRLVSRIADVLGIEVPVRTIFDRPVLEDLAAHVSATLGGGRVADEIAAAAAAVVELSDEEVASLLSRLDDGTEEPR